MKNNGLPEFYYRMGQSISDKNQSNKNTLARKNVLN